MYSTEVEGLRTVQFSILNTKYRFGFLKVYQASPLALIVNLVNISP